jgi:hypothetical protein
MLASPSHTMQSMINSTVLNHTMQSMINSIVLNLWIRFFLYKSMVKSKISIVNSNNYFFIKQGGQASDLWTDSCWPLAVSPSSNVACLEPLDGDGVGGGREGLWPPHSRESWPLLGITCGGRGVALGVVRVPTQIPGSRHGGEARWS